MRILIAMKKNMLRVIEWFRHMREKSVMRLCAIRNLNCGGLFATIVTIPFLFTSKFWKGLDKEDIDELKKMKKNVEKTRIDNAICKNQKMEETMCEEIGRKIS